MQPHKIIYYSDELHDDFANTKGAKPIKVTADYKFLKKGPLWRLGSFILYRFIATPLAYLFCRRFSGVRIENRRALQKIKGGFLKKVKPAIGAIHRKKIFDEVIN